VTDTIDPALRASKSATCQIKSACLVVDDDDYVRDSLSRLLESWGHTVEVADCGEAAVSRLRQKRFDMVISDLKLPGITGIDVLSEAKRIDEHCVVLIMTAFASVDTAVDSLEKGAFEYFVKPLNFRHVDIVIRRALTYRELQLAALEGSVDAVPDLVGNSNKMSRVRAQVRTWARNDTSVLLLGETGTGKEVVARAIHDLSNRRKEPFMVVNCGALPESLLESELFGHVKGAFTGASSDKRGLFEAAGSGTIFLDEIDSATPHTQVALLRVLDYKELRPIGSTETKKVDGRVLVASNKDIESLVSQGEFREDLFYRLISAVIISPPLRERIEDVPILVNHFIEECAAQNGKLHRKCSPKTLELMMQYPWPGNVRELKHAVQRAVMSSQRQIIRPADLPEFMRRSTAQDALPSLDEMERKLVGKALELSNWNKSEAARLIRIPRKRLYTLMRKHGLVSSSENAVQKEREELSSVQDGTHALV